MRYLVELQHLWLPKKWMLSCTAWGKSLISRIGKKSIGRLIRNKNSACGINTRKTPCVIKFLIAGGPFRQAPWRRFLSGSILFQHHDLRLRKVGLLRTRHAQLEVHFGLISKAAPPESCYSMFFSFDGASEATASPVMRTASMNFVVRSSFKAGTQETLLWGLYRHLHFYC